MKKAAFILLLLHICFLPKMLWAQENPDVINGIWADGGLGAAYPVPFLISFSGGVNFHVLKNNLFTIQGISALGLDAENNARSFGILYGKCLTSNLFLLSASAGISHTEMRLLVDGNCETCADVPKNYRTISFPIQAKIILTPIRYVGIGAQYTHNFNRIKSHGSLLMTIGIGVFREKRARLNWENAFRFQ